MSHFLWRLRGSLSLWLPFAHALGVGRTPPAARLRLAVVGDCHGQYNDDDNAALIALKPDCALFVGDFGNEELEIVRTLSKLQHALPTATILGNHDAWYLSRLLSKRRSKQKREPAATTDGGADLADCVAPGNSPRLGFTKEYASVRSMHEALAPSNVGWGRIDFDALALSIVGGRPLSSGGASLSTNAATYAELWGVAGDEQSAGLIAEHVRTAPSGAATIVLAHNGPRGLGDAKSDICGKDWGHKGGDWGDEDLRLALAACDGHRAVPLVVFGHMHDQLQGRGKRTMVHHSAEDGRLYVNAARVPRWRSSTRIEPTIERAFTMVELEDAAASTEEDAAWAATRVELVWALPTGEVTEREQLWPAMR